MSEAWRQLGTPRAGGFLLIADHASNHVPPDIDLGIDSALLSNHIAVDIGVAEVAALLVQDGPVDAAILGGVSRLVVDCNREEDAPGVLPIASDGHAVPGNALDDPAREARLVRFFRPYHAHIEATIAAYRPAMILSLHSFTPSLAAHPEQERPWHVGVLYNEDERLAAAAIAALAAEGLIVGDQLPYSGKLLNATMNRHAEGNAIPYVGIEMRQDLVGDAAGQRLFAKRLARMCHKVALNIAT
ncbi:MULTISPECIES: N-formylglutamate amidohydrolase [unclassified Sphingopyxis]|uniref:N-formylglutamate amidohydrolase n=1 Tax=unclassified Sphingopyxis TaxID=2614943 RepID=UPI00285BDA39|nr:MULTISPECIES: N-formylglutamate amidohydrolase [unclassified Sphingopyxis]MDR6831784.1 putative N-formylglutamate amidohydrolase [Sphingopyxis sp. BE122]MDR7227526.1 putative N-formylglutamate amidohydrolase [Sphingopyxis sp. BE259]